MSQPGQGLTFYVPFAAAVLLLAFGSDYNIYTVGHVWEALRGRGLRSALVASYPSAVGAVVTAGVALAASFGLLAVVPLTPFRQLAFAVGVGIALDVFVVRSVLVPALLVLLGPAGSWPSQPGQLRGFTSWVGRRLAEWNAPVDRFGDRGRTRREVAPPRVD